MKKTILGSVLVAGTMMLSGCGSLGTGTSGSTSSSTGSILGSILGGSSSSTGSTIGNVISSVLGLDNLTQKQLVGTWHYKSPGCAFTSDNALAKAGGEVAASKVKEKLATQYSKLGLSSSNTYITFGSDNSFSGKIDGKSISGTYTFDESTKKLEMKMLLMTLSGYAKKNSDGIAVLFESKKVLTLFQTLASLSGNSTLSTIGDISKNYDGVRIGFDMSK